MSGLPNVLTACLNRLSLRFHSVDCSNILEFLSATTFSDLGMWAAETDTCRSAAHCHMSKAISSYKLDLIPPPYIINISYCCIVVQYDPNMFKSSRALMCNACSCLVHMPPVSDFSQTATQPSRLASVYIVVSIGSYFKLLVAVIIFSHQVSSFGEI